MDHIESLTPSTPTKTEPILLEKHDAGVMTLTLNRPMQFNALSGELIARLQEALERIGEDRSIKVVVLAANGRGFCSGHDLKEIRGLPNRAAVEELFLACSKMMMKLGQIGQPVIAKVHGIATAAGCQLVAACDLAIASSAARFATPGVNLGTFCSTPSVALGRTVSPKHAMEMLLTGEFISAERAAEIGLINRVVDPQALNAETFSLATLLASKSSSAIATGKRVFYEHMNMRLGDAYAFASHEIACEFVSPNGQEGVDAFLQKRKPEWQ